MPSVSVTKPVMLVLTLIQLVSLVAGMIGALDSLVVGGLISIVVPVLAGIYYLGLTAEEINQQSKNCMDCSSVTLLSLLLQDG